jgi:predicted transposase YbfD/YdcC
MDPQPAYDDEQVSNFVDALNGYPDHRDTRGKGQHLSLTVVIVGVVLGILVGRSNTSSLHRFICNRIDWLRQVTRNAQASAISRAHLPRLLNQLDWVALNDLIETHFGMRLELNERQEWVAIDGKVMRGTVKSEDKQAIILAVTHESRQVVGQARQVGHKSSEIPIVRELLKSTGLDQQKVTLDAHHCNPVTTAQIQQAGGTYLIQVKENQPTLLQQCRRLGATDEFMDSAIESNKANGRVTTRHARLFSMGALILDARWQASRLTTLVVMERETVDLSTQKKSFETSYYMSNCRHSNAQTMAQVIRAHWGVEADNYIRDKTFKEDDVKTKYGNQAQIMGRLRSLAMSLIRKTGAKNFQAVIEKFTDSPSSLEAMLKQANFL